MKTFRGLLVLLCLVAILLSGASVSLAEEDEKEPDPNESEDTTEEPAKKPGPPEFKEDVTVTATRVESSLMKTPVAVTAFDQDTLDREGVQNIRDLAHMVPNMDIATNNGQSTPIISMRGVRSTNETELGDPSVGVHLDGVYSPRMQGVLALMFDNERVEILRGPQGTLFGRNSTVGSINIITAKPKFKSFEASANMRYGNYNSREVQAMVNIPVSSKFALRVAGRAHKQDSYIDGYWDPNQFDQRHIADLVQDAAVIAPGSFEDCTSPLCYTRTQHSNWWADAADDVGMEIRELVKADNKDFYMNANEWAYRLSALWQPSKDVSLNLSWQHFRNDSAGGIDLVNCEKLRGRPTYDFVYGPRGALLSVNQNGTNDCSNMFPKDDTYQAVVNTPGRLYLDIDYLRSNLTWDINPDLRFVYSAGMEDMDRESAQDMEQGLNAWDQSMFFLPGTGSQSYSHEIQLQSYGDKKFNWISGLNFFHEKTSTIGYFNNAMGEKSLWNQPNRSTDAAALFAQGTYSFTPQWHGTIGYRFSKERKEDKGGNTYIINLATGCDSGGACPRELYNSLPVDYFENPDFYPEVSPNDNAGSWENHDFRIGLDYDKNENTLLYAYIATGFKAGGIGDVFNEINPRTGEEINVRTSFDPEEVTTLELGFKQRLLDRKLELRGAFFYSDYEKMQYASVGAIAYTERWQALQDENGEYITNPYGGFVFGWVSAPIVAYYTQNVPGAKIQGFELEYEWRPWAGGRINGYATWLDTEISEDWVTKWNYDPVSYFGLSFQDAIDASNEVLDVNLKGNDLAVSPRFKVHMTIDHAFYFEKLNTTIVPWVTAHWEDASYLTIWNVQRHVDDMEFVIFDEDVKYTDDTRKPWSMIHAGIRAYHGNWTAELFAYNLTDEVVQYWGGAAEQVAKGSFSSPMNYGLAIGRKF